METWAGFQAQYYSLVLRELVQALRDTLKGRTSPSVPLIVYLSRRRSCRGRIIRTHARLTQGEVDWDVGMSTEIINFKDSRKQQALSDSESFEC